MIRGEVDERRAPLHPARRSRSSGTCRASRPRSPATSSSTRRCRSGLQSDHDLAEETVRERIVETARRAVTRKGSAGRRGGHAPVRAQPDAADARQALARAPRQPRPPAPGHPPARLCAEEPEAGVQARILRAVLGHARPHQAGRRAHRAHRAGPLAAGRRGRRGASAGHQRPLPARRLRGGPRGRGCGRRGWRHRGTAAPPRPSRSPARARRSVATSRVRAAAARSTSSATAGSAGPRRTRIRAVVPVRSSRGSAGRGERCQRTTSAGPMPAR